MKRSSRIWLALVAVAVAAVAFVLLRPGEERSSKPANTQATAPATTTTAVAKPKPKVPTIIVKGGEPVGGVRKIEVSEGGKIRFRVTADAAESVHLHGYDIEKPVGPGQAASFNVPATITGRFEVELEASAVQIAQVSVQP